MGQYDDIWYDISESIQKLGLEGEFETELENLKFIPKYRYAGTRDKWDAAYQIVIEKYKKKGHVK